MQIQDIEIPKEDPFLYDLLDRAKMVKSLTRLVGTIKGPCVMAVDAPWGTGKTTFLKMWSQYLRNEQFPVVEFNAWETDFSGDPFIALCAELTASFKAEEGTELSEITKAFKETAKKVIRHITSDAVSHITAGHVNIGELSTELMGKHNGTDIDTRLDNYQDARDAMKDFKQTLKRMVVALNPSTSGKDAGGETDHLPKVITKTRHCPLMIMIDELDRCRPSYAVELLETTKHLFALDQIIFVLAVNRMELQHAVKALYGNDFGAEAYLRRFFNVDLHLPEANREKYIDRLLVSIGVEDTRWFQKLLKAFFDESPFTLRDIAQAIHRLGLALRSLPDDNDTIEKMAAVALILRTYDEALYHRFAEREVSDLELADSIFAIPSVAPLRWTEEGIWFQVGIVRAYKELSESYDTTPLEDKIRHYIDDGEDASTKQGLENAFENANQALKKEYIFPPEFHNAYRHIELFFGLTKEESEDSKVPFLMTMGGR